MVFHRQTLLTIVVLTALLLGMLPAAAPAQAATTIVVTSLLDNGPGTSQRSARCAMRWP